MLFCYFFDKNRKKVKISLIIYLNKNIKMVNIETKKIDSLDIETYLTNELKNMEFNTLESLLKNNFQHVWFDNVEISNLPKYKTLVKTQYISKILFDNKEPNLQALDNISENEKEHILFVLLKDNILEKLKNWQLTITTLKNRISKLNMSDDIDTILKKFALSSMLESGRNVFSFDDLKQKYDDNLQSLLRNYINIHPNNNSTMPVELAYDMKYKALEKTLDSIHWDWYTNDILLKLFDNNKKKLVKSFERIANWVDWLKSQITSVDWWNDLWEDFKKKGIFGTINDLVEKTKMNRAHKEALKALATLWVVIAWIIWFFKYMTSDCAIPKFDGKWWCAVKWWFWIKLFTFGGGEFVYNHMTDWRWTLWWLVWKIFSWWLDDTSLPSNSNSHSVQETLLELKNSVDVDVRRDLSSPLLVNFLFQWLTYDDFWDNIKDSNGDIDLNKLKNYLEEKSKNDSKYVLPYLMVKGVLDTKVNRQKKQEEFKESIKEGILWLNLENNPSEKVEDAFAEYALRRDFAKSKIQKLNAILRNSNISLPNHKKQEVKDNFEKYVEKYVKWQINLSQLKSDLVNIIWQQTVDILFNSPSQNQNNNTSSPSQTPNSPSQSTNNVTSGSNSGIYPDAI